MKTRGQRSSVFFVVVLISWDLQLEFKDGEDGFGLYP